MDHRERPLNKAAATLEKQLRHLMLLYLWADARACTPEGLIRSAGFFTLEQLNDLDRFCRQPLSDAVAAVLEIRDAGRSMVSIRGRKLKESGRPGVRTDVGNRLTAIHAFLDHVSFAHVSRMEPASDARRLYEESRKAILSILRERCRAFLPTRGVGESREGLAQETRLVLLAAIRPGHADNPWEPPVQRRNELIVRLLYDLGMRRGEGVVGQFELS